MQIYAIPFSGIKTISIRCFVFVGSIYENERNNGISHFLEHMLFRGNKRLGDATTMSLKIEELGGEMNAATSFDMTEYWFDFHKDYLTEGIHRFCTFLQYPLFEQIEIERSIILEEILADYNENNQLVDLDSLTSKQLWPHHSMGLPVIGNMKTINEIARSDLFEWHERYYQPGNMVIGITGDIQVQDVFQQIDTEFVNGNRYSERESYPEIRADHLLNDQIRIVEENDNQFSLQWAFPFYELSKPLRIDFELIRRVMDDGNSSRLQRLIREEKGLVYDISADMLFFRKGAVLSIQSIVGTGRLKDLMQALVELVEDLQKNGVTAEEFELAKLRYKAALDCAGDTPQGELYSLLNPILYPEGYTIEEVFRRLDTLELDQLNETLRKILIQNSTAFVLVGPNSAQKRELLERLLRHWIRGKNIS